MTNSDVETEFRAVTINGELDRLVIVVNEYNPKRGYLTLEFDLDDGDSIDVIYYHHVKDWSKLLSKARAK